MSTKKKLLLGAAGAAAAGGAGLDVDEVFSTFLYDGTSSAQTITNGIDLSGEGGLVWTKARDYGVGHALVDTVRGNTKYLEANGTDAEATTSVGITAFNSTGYNLGADDTWKFNVSNSYVSEYVSWTFRKAKKFFDVVTYSGQNTDLALSHNLGVAPGMVIIKRTDDSGHDWYVWHRSLNQSENLVLNSDGDVGGNNFWTSSAPSSTVFNIDGNRAAINQSGGSYVAYLFAHNDNSDGEFGPDSDQDIIKCGSYTGNTSGTEVDLGFEPQFVMIKKSSASESWYVYDNMRGVVTGGANSQDKKLRWNTSGAEAAVASPIIAFSSKGFILESTENEINGSGTYVYMAIRRGPLAAPTDATKVFAMDDSSTTDIGGYTLNSNFPVDFYFFKSKTGGDSISIPRLTVGDLRFNSSTAEEDRSSSMNFDSNTGVTRTSFQGGIDSVDYAFRRAPSFFDVCCYSGTAIAGLAITHNLGAVPEMMWVKNRSSNADWYVYHSGLGNTKYLKLNASDAQITNSGAWNDTSPTSSQFTVGSHNGVNGDTTYDYISYLFATVAGVSKVASYTGNGGTQNIDCGFSSGARFILIKSATDAGSWFVHDSVRGIVAGNDPRLKLDQSDAEMSADYVDPLSSGFTVNGPGNNDNGQTYIFYAIA